MAAITTKTHRLESIDYLRGLVMVIMALDHVRAYFSYSSVGPLDSDASLPLYLTRLVTNICAPTFVLLAGVSVGLMSRRKTKADLSRFLLSRGLWLIGLEATVVTFGWKFNLSNHPGIILQVIWAIGVAMIVLGCLIHLHRNAVLAVGIAIVLGHNILDGMLPSSGFPFEVGPFWLNLHRQVLWQPGDLNVIMAYPTLAWIGVMCCGYGLATVFSWESMRRQQFLFGLGGGLLFIFFFLRWLNIYGDPVTWQSGESNIQTLRNFFNVSKYPPSLLYLSFNLGFASIILSVAERWRQPLNKALVTIGRVPLFFYLIHIYVTHFLAVLAGILQGLPASAWFVDSHHMPDGYGFELPVIYFVWLCILLVLYPACRWYARLKATRKDWWLSYL